MKRFLYMLLRALCCLARWVLCVLLSISVISLMMLQVMPLTVSIFVDYLGFTDDATLAAVLLMAGIPLLFFAGVAVYGVVKFLNFGCGYIMKYFREMEENLTHRIDLVGHAGK